MMQNIRTGAFAILLILVCALGFALGGTDKPAIKKDSAAPQTRVDSVVMPWGEVRYDTVQLRNDSTDWQEVSALMARTDSASRYTTLTDADYERVASELGIEVATMKAVVRIEAGASLEGFWAPGVPVINFDKSMYNKSRAPSNKRAPASMKVPDGIKSAYGRREWSQLIAHRKINEDKANMGTFWGMFQIGGFNYKMCGCASVDEFVMRMSYSEFEQLELFAAFIRNTGMLNDLRNKNWAAFSRKYNGPSYAKRGYHTRMAAEYAKFKKQESQK